MEHVAIVERHQRTWFVHVPELQIGMPIDDPNEAPDTAARLIAETAGLAPGEVQIAVRLVRQSDVLVSTASSPVRARHFDGAWHAGHRRGWVRQANKSWRAVVCYVIDGVQWERALNPGQFASLDPDRAPAVSRSSH